MATVPVSSFASPSLPSSSQQCSIRLQTLSLASSPKHYDFHLKTAKPSYSAINLRPTFLPRVRGISTSKTRFTPTLAMRPSNSFICPTPSLSDSTRTVTTLFSSALWLSKVMVHVLQKFSQKLVEAAANFQPSPEDIAKIHSLRECFVSSAGPLFFARAKSQPSGSLNTPLTVVAAGMSKWLDIYSGVLMVRILLSWFPNIPWERQPLSAIRDLCDPYLNLFRNIIPPIFDALDVSPLLAFAVLGTLGSILNSSRAGF